MRVLIVNKDRCTGCRRCELACSFHHHHTYSLTRTRIHVVREKILEKPIICIQCGLCQYACPIEGAIIRDKKTGAFLITTKCNVKQCNMECINACPYGVIHIDLKLNRPIKCDFCGGSPVCVNACVWDAIQYLDANSPKVLYTKRISHLQE